MSVELGRKLKDARNARALSLREVAKKSDGELSYSALSRIERGERYPNFETVYRICQALRIELSITGAEIKVKLL